MVFLPRILVTSEYSSASSRLKCFKIKSLGLFNKLSTPAPCRSTHQSQFPAKSPPHSRPATGLPECRFTAKPTLRSAVFHRSRPTVSYSGIKSNIQILRFCPFLWRCLHCKIKKIIYFLIRHKSLIFTVKKVSAQIFSRYRHLIVYFIYCSLSVLCSYFFIIF